MTTPAIRPDSARHNGKRRETSPIGEIKHELAETAFEKTGKTSALVSFSAAC
jgi:hypothetical protein